MAAERAVRGEKRERGSAERVGILLFRDGKGKNKDKDWDWCHTWSDEVEAASYLAGAESGKQRGKRLHSYWLRTCSLQGTVRGK